MILYQIVNKINGDRYYGTTARSDFKYRKREHLYPLRTGKHFNRYLQAAWNKYGEEAFDFEIIRRFSTQEELNQAEIEIIENSQNTYNLAKGGNSFVHTEATKRVIGESSKISVVGMSIKTGEIKEYPSVKDTALDGFNPKNIGKCCQLSISRASGRIQQAISTKKWVWMYKSEFNIEEMERRRLMALRRGNNDQSRAVIGKSLIDGSLIYFRSCLEAARALNGSHQTIWKICNGGNNAKSHKTYVWVFVDEVEPAILLDKRYLCALDTFNGHRVIGPRSKRSKLKKI